MKKTASLLILATFCITLYFQACGVNQNTKFSENKSENTETVGGANGDGYTGKPSPYDFRNANNACFEKGANGKPLPNEQIFIFPSGAAQLVRQNCIDITPVPLAGNEYQITNSGDLIYQNKTFATNLSQTPFDVVAASCPVGKTLIPTAVRTSLVKAPLDLFSNDWARDQLNVTFEGSLASLPLYKVERVDPNALEAWHRMNQSPHFVTGQDYVFSFFAKPDAVEKVMFTSYFNAVQDLRIRFDLISGAAQVDSSVGVTNLSTQAKMMGGGLYISVYFRSNSDVNANIGIASAGEFIGSSVSITALQLERISNFCTP